jgi:hypothetical protein
VPRLLLVPALVAALVVVGADAAASSGRAERSLTLRLISTPTSQSVDDIAPKTTSKGELTRGDAIRGTSVLANAVRQLGKAKGSASGRTAS